MNVIKPYNQLSLIISKLLIFSRVFLIYFATVRRYGRFGRRQDCTRLCAACRDVRLLYGPAKQDTAMFSKSVAVLPATLSDSTFVIAAVRVVLPWSTWPMVPILQCGLFLSNLAHRDEETIPCSLKSMSRCLRVYRKKCLLQRQSNSLGRDRTRHIRWRSRPVQGTRPEYLPSPPL